MRWIDHIYLAYRSFWDIQQKKDMSNFFKRLLAIRQDLVSRAGSIDGASAWLQDCVKGGQLIVSEAYHSLRPKANRQP